MVSTRKVKAECAWSLNALCPASDAHKEVKGGRRRVTHGPDEPASQRTSAVIFVFNFFRGLTWNAPEMITRYCHYLLPDTAIIYCPILPLFTARYFYYLLSDNAIIYSPILYYLLSDTAIIYCPILLLFTARYCHYLLSDTAIIYCPILLLFTARYCYYLLPDTAIIYCPILLLFTARYYYYLLLRTAIEILISRFLSNFDMS